MLSLMMIKKLLFFCLLGFLLSTTFQVHSQVRKFVLCIDPGHGGTDPGKPKGTKKMLDERDLNLNIALKLGGYIQNRIEGATVIYTRTTDTTVTLDERVNFANKHQADFFISIHCNSNPNKATYGTKTHIHSHEFKKSQALALRVEQEFAKRANRNSRGVQSAADRGMNLFVLQYTDMPAVLIEAGFLTNAKEERYLNSDYGQDIIASAIFRAFRDFVSKSHNYAVGDRSTVYKVQLMAAATPMKRKSKKLRDLGLRIVEHKATGKFPYRYMVGREYDKNGANRLLAEVKKKGFKDAYIEKMTNAKSKKYRIIED